MEHTEIIELKGNLVKIVTDESNISIIRFDLDKFQKLFEFLVLEISKIDDKYKAISDGTIDSLCINAVKNSSEFQLEDPSDVFMLGYLMGMIRMNIQDRLQQLNLDGGKNVIN